MKTPKIKDIETILPKEEILLMGAGPVPIPKEVALANSKVISHLGEPMNTITDDIQEMGRYIFQTETTKIFGISGPSSSAMEMAITSVVKKGTKTLVLNLGTFSHRFTELALGVGGDVTELTPEPHSPFRAEDVKKELERNNYEVLALVQGETSCGIKNIELGDITKIAKNLGVITIADTVCTLTTMPFNMDDWGIDIALTGGQKGLSSIAGVSLIAFSEEVFSLIQKRTEVMPHWCLDPRRAYKFWCEKEYHYTAPVNGLLALHEALRLICVETLPKKFKRHETSANLLQSYLESMGFTLYAPKEWRLNSVVAINNMKGIVVRDALKIMKEKHNVQVSGAFGLDIFRVGQMGEQCRPTNLKRVLKAIGESYKELGAPVDLTTIMRDLEDSSKFNF